MARLWSKRRIPERHQMAGLRHCDQSILDHVVITLMAQ